MRHVASLLTLLAFVLLAAAYVPGNQIKARLHHPMVLGVKAWALAHLAANGNDDGRATGWGSVITGLPSAEHRRLYLRAGTRQSG